MTKSEGFTPDLRVQPILSTITHWLLPLFGSRRRPQDRMEMHRATDNSSVQHILRDSHLSCVSMGPRVNASNTEAALYKP